MGRASRKGCGASRPLNMPFATPDFLAPLLAKPVAIFGGGVSGEGVRALLTALGAEGQVYDPKGAEFTMLAARAHSLVVFSPGFAPEHPWLERARATGAECLGELDFASLGWRGRVVSVTGTNGKTTLTEFLTHALRSVGRDAHATGNIGRSNLCAKRATDEPAKKPHGAVCATRFHLAEKYASRPACR